MLVYHLPNFLCVNPKLVVRDDVSEILDAVPGYLLVLVFGFSTEFSDHFADDDKIHERSIKRLAV